MLEPCAYAALRGRRTLPLALLLLTQSQTKYRKLLRTHLPSRLITRPVVTTLFTSLKTTSSAFQQARPLPLDSLPFPTPLNLSTISLTKSNLYFPKPAPTPPTTTTAFNSASPAVTRFVCDPLEGRKMQSLTALLRPATPSSSSSAPFSFDDEPTFFNADIHVSHPPPPFLEDATLPPSPPLVGGALFGATPDDDDHCSNLGPAHGLVPVEHAALNDFNNSFTTASDPFPFLSTFATADSNCFSGNPQFLSGPPKALFDESECPLEDWFWEARRAQEQMKEAQVADLLVSLSPFLPGPAFDLSEYLNDDAPASVHIQQKSHQQPAINNTGFATFSSLNNPTFAAASSSSNFSMPPPLSAAYSFIDPQARATEFNSLLESPLELDASPSLNDSPWFSPAGDAFLPFGDSTTAGPLPPLFPTFPELRLTHDTSVGGPSSTIVSAPIPAQVVPLSLPAAAFPATAATDESPSLPPLVEDDEDDLEDDEEYIPSPPSASDSSRPASVRKRKPIGNGKRDEQGKRIFTGTRVNHTVPILPFDAPVQKREYKGESKTSRKVVPKAMARSIPIQRRRNVSVGVDELAATAGDDKLDDETLDLVQQKRKANTIAARISRAKKADHLAGLENKVAELTEENAALVEENETLKERLRAAGLH